MSKPDFKRGDILVTEQGLPFICSGKYEDERETVGALGGVVKMETMLSAPYRKSVFITTADETAWTDWDTARLADPDEVDILIKEMQKSMSPENKGSIIYKEVKDLYEEFITPVLKGRVEKEERRKRIEAADWEQRRYEIAKECVTVLMKNEISPEDAAKLSVEQADALIKELKK